MLELYKQQTKCLVALDSIIFGFDGEEIYIIWDCFWFAIKDEEKRKIKLINN